MGISRIATYRPTVSNTAARIIVDGQEITLTQAQLAAYRFFPALRAEFKAQARLLGIDLANIKVHINRDGLVCLAFDDDRTAWINWMESPAMVRSVEAITITNWQQTGSNVPFPQYQFDLEISWTDNQGNPQTHTGTYRFPNDISDMPLSVRRRYAEEMVIAAARVQLGIDEWPDYE